MSLSCHLQWGHDQDLMCGVSKGERESCHVSLMMDYIEKIIGTRAVFVSSLARHWEYLPFTRYRRNSSSKLRPSDCVGIPPFLLRILGPPTPEHFAHVLPLIMLRAPTRECLAHVPPLMMLTALTRAPVVPAALLSAQLRPFPPIPWTCRVSEKS